jgi:hypothetical protein
MLLDMTTLTFEGYQWTDYDPATFEAKRTERVDVAFQILGDTLTLTLGNPVNQVVHLTSATKRIAELLRALDPTPNSPEKT